MAQGLPWSSLDFETNELKSFVKLRVCPREHYSIVVLTLLLVCGADQCYETYLKHQDEEAVKLKTVC